MEEVTGQMVVSINLDNHNEIDTADRKQMAMDRIKQDYLNVCYNGTYITEITHVQCGVRKHRRKTMYGESTMSVIVDYRAVTVTEEGEIIHNCLVKKITRDRLPISLACVSGPYISVTAEIETKNVITEGMTIPVRIIYCEFTQDINNMINVYGDVIHPQLFENIEYFVTKPSDEELKDAALYVTDIEDKASHIMDMPRANYFRSWIYPHKKNITKNLSLIDIITGATAPSNLYIEINDKCDPMNFEYTKTIKHPGIRTVSFSDIVTFMVKCAARAWSDIENLCRTYESDDMFKTHEPLFKYYENAKDTDKSALYINNTEEKVEYENVNDIVDNTL
jgi:hypothetical protein